jgi:hypothetical protein
MNRMLWRWTRTYRHLNIRRRELERFPALTHSARADRIQVPFTLRGRQYLAEILPAQIKDGRIGQERLAFPGSREEPVEHALRFIAVQQIAKTKLTPDLQTGRQAVTVFFSLSMLRRHLEELGHRFKLNEIKEALDNLSGTMIELSPVEEQEVEPQKGKRSPRRRHFTKATLTDDSDNTGSGSFAVKGDLLALKDIFPGRCHPRRIKEM